MDKIATDEKQLNTSRLKSLTLNVTQIEEDDKNSKEIHIPRIEDLFKNQSKEILVYENTTLREKLGKMIHKLDEGITKFKNLSFSYSRPDEELSLASRTFHYNVEENYEKNTDSLLSKSKDLRELLYKEKKEMAGRAPGEGSKANTTSNMSYFLREIEKPKHRE